MTIEYQSSEGGVFDMMSIAGPREDSYPCGAGCEIDPTEIPVTKAKNGLRQATAAKGRDPRDPGGTKAPSGQNIAGYASEERKMP